MTMDNKDNRCFTGDLEKACSILRNGGLVAFPTDTLYALGANIFDESAINKVFETKERLRNMALPVLIGKIDDIYKIAFDVDKNIRALMEAFWPGPLTLVLKKKSDISDVLTAGNHTVAVRMPNHQLALDLIKNVGSPLTGTSANSYGGTDPTHAYIVKEQIGSRVDMILDGGICPMQGASTILDVSSQPPKLIRQGVLSYEELRRVFKTTGGLDGI
jgi:L-threonylcarbamoyladenylate synthase